MALAGGMDKAPQLWDARTGRLIHTLRGHPGGITAAAFSPDGKRALAGDGGGNIKLWDVVTGAELITFQTRGEAPAGSAHPILSLSFSPDGRQAVSGSTDYEVRIWSVETGRQERVLSGHHGPVKSVSFSADGKMVLTAGGDARGGGCCKWWDLATGKELGEVCDSDYMKFAAFTPSGREVLTGGGTTLKLWDVARRKQLLALDHKGFIDCATISRSGKLALSAGGSGVINVWDLVAGQLVKTLGGDESAVSSLGFGPDDRTALSGGSDGIVKLWDISTGGLIRSFPPTAVHGAVAFAS